MTSLTNYNDLTDAVVAEEENANETNEEIKNEEDEGGTAPNDDSKEEEVKGDWEADEDAKEEQEKGDSEADEDYKEETKEKKPNKKRSKKNSGASEEPPKKKKLRVKPEKVREVYKKIIDELAKTHTMGIVETPIDTLAISVGYKNPRSDAMLAAFKELKKDGLVEKTGKVCKFTEKGIKDHVPEAQTAGSPEEALEMFWKQFEMKLESNPKSSGEKAAIAAKVVWDQLKDGSSHTKDALVGPTTYSMARSTGFGELMKALKDLGFTQTSNGEVCFTDKVFPLGRPE